MVLIALSPYIVNLCDRKDHTSGVFSGTGRSLNQLPGLGLRMVNPQLLKVGHQFLRSCKY